jgi:predicted methyltransferase
MKFFNLLLVTLLYFQVMSQEHKITIEGFNNIDSIYFNGVKKDFQKINDSIFIVVFNLDTNNLEILIRDKKKMYKVFGINYGTDSLSSYSNLILNEKGCATIRINGSSMFNFVGVDVYVNNRLKVKKSCGTIILKNKKRNLDDGY